MSAEELDTRVIDTREKAIIVFRTLTALYGLRWGAQVPAVAYERLKACNAFLTETDRREIAKGTL